MVVGGTSGLGLHLARRLATENARVVILARNTQRLVRTVYDLRDDDRFEVSGFPADVTSLDSTQAGFRQVMEAVPHIDAVFNCVGKSTREKVLDVDVARMREMMDVNLMSTLNVARVAIPYLVPSGGHLVHIGSLASKTAWPWVTSYAVSKSAMATYTHQLRLEGPPEVHYMLVCPGPIARSDTGSRYDEQVEGMPEQAKAGAAGAKLKGIDPQKLVTRILRGCQQRKRELIVPRYARIAFIASAISPALGDWILRKKMSK